ncbi:MAG: chemotaxis protein CheW [Oligoflexus sp.]
MLLKDLMSFQNLSRSKQSDHEQEVHQQLLPCMKFHWGDGAFLIGIDFVKEVIENHHIIPYPENHLDHLGLVNLRGQILPIIRPSFYNGIQGQKSDRLMVIELDDRRIFCIQVNRVQKVAIPKERLSQEVMNIDNTPIRMVQEQDFKAMDVRDE